MKLLILLLSATFSTQVFAATKSFDVKAQVSIDGKLISSPHLITKPNEIASISQKVDGNKETLIELVASDNSPKDMNGAILMKFTVSSVENGKRTLISKAQIIALPGEPAEISERTTGKSSALKLSVVATRVQ